MKALIYFVAMEKSQKFEETDPGDVVEAMVEAYEHMTACRDRLAAAEIRKLVAQRNMDAKKEGLKDYMNDPENKKEFPNETTRKLYIIDQTTDERHEMDKRSAELIMATKDFENAQDEVQLMRDLILLGWKYDETGPTEQCQDIHGL